MKRNLWLGIFVLIAGSIAGPHWGLAQAPAQPGRAPYVAGDPDASRVPDPNPVPLDFVPRAFDEIGTRATKSSFTFDRSMLSAAAGLMGGNMDDQTKQAVNKLDGVSVHMLRFGAEGYADPAAIDAIRQAYHLRGWKHVMTTTASGGPIQNGKTDVWVVLDGANVRGAVVLVDTPGTLTLATVAGNLSPEDLLHLRGHFGIPRFDGDKLENEKGRLVQ